MRILLAAIFLSAAVSNQSVAQENLKIGYTNVDYILSLMPEAKQIESDYKAYEKQLQNRLEAKFQEYQQKVETFRQEQSTMTDLILADRQNELRSLQEDIEKFQREAEVSLQNKQIELFQPAYKKITDTINEVAQENGYTHVFSDNASGLQVLLYARTQDDISNLVLKKLGIEPPAEGSN